MSRRSGLSAEKAPGTPVANTIEPSTDAAANPVFDPKRSVIGIASDPNFGTSDEHRQESWLGRDFQYVHRHKGGEVAWSISK